MFRRRNYPLTAQTVPAVGPMGTLQTNLPMTLAQFQELVERLHPLGIGVRAERVRI